MWKARLVKVSRWEEQAPKNTNTNPKVYRTCLRMLSCYESKDQIRAFTAIQNEGVEVLFSSADEFLLRESINFEK